MNREYSWYPKRLNKRVRIVVNNKKLLWNEFMVSFESLFTLDQHSLSESRACILNSWQHSLCCKCCLFMSTLIVLKNLYENTDLVLSTGSPKCCYILCKWLLRWPN